MEATNVVMTSKKTRLYPPATAPTTSFLTPVFSPFPAPQHHYHPVCIIPHGKVHTGRSHAPPQRPEARRQPTTLPVTRMERKVLTILSSSDLRLAIEEEKEEEEEWKEERKARATRTFILDPLESSLFTDYEAKLIVV